MIIIVDNTVSKKRYLNKLKRFLSSSGYAFGVIKTLSDFEDLKKKTTSVTTSVTPSVSCFILSGSERMVSDFHDVNSINRTNSTNGTKILLDTVIASTLEETNSFYEVPIVGICFGAQYLNVFFRGTLKEIQQICEMRNIKWRGENNLTENDRFKFCLHYLPDKMGKDLIPRAYLGRDPVVFTHETQPIIGFLFHPEHDKAGRRVLKSVLRYLEGEGWKY